MVKTSVIIPVYNVEPFIAETIRSVLAQTDPDFELLIIDDGSCDRSFEICQQFTDPRIQLMRQTNRGVSAARNTGLRQAQGDYIALMDGDDLWRPEKLEKQITHLARSPEVGVSFCRSEFIDEAGNALGTYLMPKLKHLDVLDLLRGNPVGNGSTPVIRRAVFEAIRYPDPLHDGKLDCFFDETLARAEDIECWLRILIQTPWQIEGLPEVLTLYRVNTSSLSASPLKQFESWEMVLERTRAYAPDLIARWGNLSKAYQLQYLARRAIQLKAGALAVQLIHRALRTYWQIVLEDPRRTLLIWGVAYLLRLLPPPVYHWLETLGQTLTGHSQKRQISKDLLR